MGLEIERKFLLAEPPAWLAECPSVPIEQGYLALGEDLEVRLRRAGERRMLTVKRGAGEVRDEVEVELEPRRFEALWPLTERRRVVKTRYRKPLADDLDAEIDVYGDRLEGLLVAEIEFPTPERSRAFQPPAWLAAEVTGDARYANRSLALDGHAPIGKGGAGNGSRVSSGAEKSGAFRLKRREGAADGLRRVARGRAGNAVDALRDRNGDQAEAIHSARKNLKKLRAVLRLSRDELGRKAFRRENRRYRDAGRLLSRSRDAEVKLETLAALQQRFGAEFPGGVHNAWALALEAERDAVVGEDAGAEVERAVEAIEAGSAEIDAWPLREQSWKAIGPGLTRSYRDGRRELAATRDRGQAENVHEWRKRAKDLTYQLRLLRDAWPEVLGDTVEEAKRLTDLLGDHHDLAVLAEDLRGRQLGREAELGALIERRQAELLAEAMELGRRLYAEKPKAFERRLRSYWLAWRDE